MDSQGDDKRHPKDHAPADAVHFSAGWLFIELFVSNASGVLELATGARPITFVTHAEIIWVKRYAFDMP